MLFACDGSDVETGPPVPNSLTYMVRVDAQTAEGRLVVDLKRQHATVDRQEFDTDRRRRELGDEEFAELLALFSNERAWIYSADTSREDGTNPPGLDCSQAQANDDDALICQAQEIGHLSVFVDMSMATGPMQNGLYGTLFFEAPVDLSLESAQAIVFLEDMRARTEQEGTLLGGE